MSRLLELLGVGKVIRKPAFLVHTAEIANHFGPIWDALAPHPFDVLLYGDATLPSGMSTDRWPMGLHHVSEALGRNARYEVLVSNHIIDPKVRKGRKKKPLIIHLGRTNLRMMYAAGKSGWNMSDWNSLYDGVLCFGPKHAEAFVNRFKLPVVQMGYPRFDRFFRDAPDLEALARHFGCDPAKRTVVWLPTWKSLSSVGHFNDEIAALRTDFNVVVKVHPLMPQDEPERVAALSAMGLNAVITDATDNVPLYQLADFMLFDYGGPPFAGIYTAKKFVLLNVPGAENDALTGADSPDLLLRRDLVNIDPGSGRLVDIFNCEEGWQRHAEVSNRLRAEYFAPNFGTSADVAADAILHRGWLRHRGSR